MNVLVVGSGGREHALIWALSQSPLNPTLYCAPGNAGISSLAQCLPIAVDQIESLVKACQEHHIDFVVIGPEVPLSLGLADQLRKANITCFGPSQAAAEIESSKGFMKDLAAAAGVPTAEYKRFTNAKEAHAYVKTKGAPIVIKADGLAAGKGVTVAQTVEEALHAIDDAMVRDIFGSSGHSLVIEEFMTGEEASFFAICDGRTAIPFAAAQDHKAVFDGDKGPNTGGMGAYSPTPVIDTAMQEHIMREIINPTVKTMHDMGRPFTGVLFAGLMITSTGPKLIEFNARFGDPETEAMLPLLKSDLLALLHAASTGKLAGMDIEWHKGASLSVIMAAQGYPGEYQKNTVIRHLERAAAIPGVLIFHAGTNRHANGDIQATGGRVLAITATAPTIREAQALAYKAVDQIAWPEGFCRRDIGWRAIAKEKAA